MTKKKLFLILLPLAVFMASGVLLASTKSSRFEAGCPCIDLVTANGEFNEEGSEAYFGGKKMTAPLADLIEPSWEEQQVLGEAIGKEKWIEVDLSEQKLRAWEGNNLFLETLISSGKPWTPTITGEFRIWSKFHYAKMSGGIKGTSSYYYLPNVPYIMYFHKDFALHGTYWHNNFGAPMSHGCVNLPTPIAEKLFYWTNPQVPTNKHFISSDKDNLGTKVVVHE